MNLKTICGLVIQVDKEDIVYLNKYKWYRLVGRNVTYARTNVDGKTKVLTHVLAKKYHWNLEGKVIDHINGNGLDNRKDNLRIVTQQENTINQDGWKKRKGKYKNVRPFRNKFAASFMYKGVTYNLGLFKTEQEGAAAVAKKRKEVCH